MALFTNEQNSGMDPYERVSALEERVIALEAAIGGSSEPQLVFGEDTMDDIGPRNCGVFCIEFEGIGTCDDYMVVGCDMFVHRGSDSSGSLEYVDKWIRDYQHPTTGITWPKVSSIQDLPDGIGVWVHFLNPSDATRSVTVRVALARIEAKEREQGE